VIILIFFFEITASLFLISFSCIFCWAVLRISTMLVGVGGFAFMTMTVSLLFMNVW